MPTVWSLQLEKRNSERKVRSIRFLFFFSKTINIIWLGEPWSDSAVALHGNGTGTETAKWTSTIGNNICLNQIRTRKETSCHSVVNPRDGASSTVSKKKSHFHAGLDRNWLHNTLTMDPTLLLIFK